jgi:hypothetical protein
MSALAYYIMNRSGRAGARSKAQESAHELLLAIVGGLGVH